jgi:hypothetical protein
MLEIKSELISEHTQTLDNLGTVITYSYNKKTF